MQRPSLFVELCAGTAALSLRLAHPRARPPVSRMGAKTGYADVILRCMGLRPGQGAEHYLWCEPDAGVRLLLHAYRDRELATAAAGIIRSWEAEEPRALWERLRAEGPAVCPPVDAQEVARWLTSHALTGLSGGYDSAAERAARGERWGGDVRDFVPRRLDAAPTLPATIADDAREVDPREVARWSFLHQGSFQYRGPAAGIGRPEGRESWGGGGAIAPVAEMLPRLLEPMPTLPATIAEDAREVDPREVARWVMVLGGCHPSKMDGRPIHQWAFTEWAYEAPKVSASLNDSPIIPATIADDAREVDPPRLPPGVVVYIDPPYLGTTGYAHLFPRSEWLPVVRRWKDAGALVVVSEAEAIPELMSEGWHAVRIDGERRGQKRTFSKQQAEWLTMSEPPKWRPSVQGRLFHSPVESNARNSS